jgi:5-methylcytosine-specific restriction protein A
VKRGKPLTRRTPLVRRAPLREVSAKRVTAGVKPTRRRDTGPGQPTRDLVYERDGYCCVWCGRQLLTGPRSLQHRQARGMGGTTDPAANNPSNLILLCGSATTPGGCHLWAEQRGDDARIAGLWVPSWQNPADVPVLHAAYGPCLLADDGSVIPLEKDAA